MPPKKLGPAPKVEQSRPPNRLVSLPKQALSRLPNKPYAPLPPHHQSLPHTQSLHSPCHASGTCATIQIMLFLYPELVYTTLCTLHTLEVVHYVPCTLCTLGNAHCALCTIHALHAKQIVRNTNVRTEFCPILHVLAGTAAVAACCCQTGGGGGRGSIYTLTVCRMHSVQSSMWQCGVCKNVQCPVPSVRNV